MSVPVMSVEHWGGNYESWREGLSRRSEVRECGENQAQI